MSVDGCWQGAVFYNAQGGFELTALTEMKKTTFLNDKKENVTTLGFEPQAFCVQNKHFGTELRAQLQITLVALLQKTVALIGIWDIKS